MKISIMISWLLYCLIFLSCSNKNIRSEEPIINIKLDETIDRIYYSDLFRDYKIILLENSNESIIGRLSDIRLHKNKLYIHDRRFSKAILIFSLDGKFIKKIGSLGKGPGEYISTLDFEIDKLNNELIILSYKKLLIYDLEGGFKEAINIKFPANDLVCFGNRIYLHPFSSTKENHPKFCAYSINRKGKELKTYLEFPLHKKGYFRDFIFGNPGFLCRTNNAVRLNIPFCDTIFSLYKNSASPFMSFESKDLLSYESMSLIMEKPETRYQAVRKFIESGKITAYNHYCENDRIIYLNYFYKSNQHYIIYNKIDNITYCTSSFFDDLTNTHPILLNLTNEYMIGYLPINIVFKLKDEILTLLPESNKEIFIDDISESNFNPIIFLFKLKKW